MAKTSWIITTLFVVIICFHQTIGVNNTNLNRQARSADFFSNLTAPIRNLFKSEPDNETVITPVGEVSSYPLWKIHKYNGVHLKPINLGSIPYLEVPAPAIKQHKKFEFPSLDQLQVLLGTNSNAETFDAIKEMASTREGLKLMAEYIKANIGDTGVDLMSMKKEEIDSMLNHYQYNVLSKETAKPIASVVPVTPAPVVVESEQNTESIISRIHSFFSSKPIPTVVKAVEAPIAHPRFVYNLPPRQIHHFNHFNHYNHFSPIVPAVNTFGLHNPFVQVVPQIQPVPVYIVPQIIYKQEEEKKVEEVVTDDSDGSQNSDTNIEPMANIESDSAGASLAQWQPPTEHIHNEFKVEKPVETYGPPPEEYGPPPPTSYGLDEKSDISVKNFNRFGHVSDAIDISRSNSKNEIPEVKTDNQNAPSHSSSQFFKQSASILVGPKVQRTGTDTIIPFPVLPELPPLPDAEKFAYFQPPPSNQSPGSFRFLPIDNLDHSSVSSNAIFNPEPPKSSVFSFSSGPSEAFHQADRQIITSKFEQPGFSYTQLSSLPLEGGIQFKNQPGQVSSFGDKISSHIFEDDPLAAASETKIVVLKDKIDNVVKSTTSSPTTPKYQRQRWIPKSKRKSENASAADSGKTN